MFLLNPKMRAAHAFDIHRGLYAGTFRSGPGLGKLGNGLRRQLQSLAIPGIVEKQIVPILGIAALLPFFSPGD